MTRLFPHASNSEVIAAISNKPRRCPPSDMERLIPVRVSTTSCSHVAFDGPFKARNVFCRVDGCVDSEAQTFSSPNVRRWGGNRVNQRHKGSRWGKRRTLEEESEGSWVLVKHYVTALTRKWNAQHQSGVGPRSKPALHSPIWFCLTSALLFPSLLFFSASQLHFSSFLRAGLLFFPFRNSSTLLRQQRGSTQGERSKKTKPATDSLVHTHLATFLPFSCTVFHVSIFWSCL